MPSYDCVAMLLAGGEGKRLGPLTRNNAKPAVSFGGKFRIIDFTLSNLANSGIDTIGVLTQYQPLILNSYIGIGNPWDLDRKHGGVTILPPYVEKGGAHWYKGTANSIYQNLAFIRQYQPNLVLIISGDHIYKMNYQELIQYHLDKSADVTIAVKEVDRKEASRFGIMNVEDNYKIYEFEEKPMEPKSNLASMGIYIFNREVLEKYLEMDEMNQESSNDFGKDVIPLILREGKNLYAYPYKGYWKDVGTIESLWEANMDLLKDDHTLDLHDNKWRIYSLDSFHPPAYIGPQATVNHSYINEGTIVNGTVENSIVFYGADIGVGSVIRHSVIMPNVKIGPNVSIHHAMICEGIIIQEGCHIEGTEDEIILVETNCGK